MLENLPHGLSSLLELSKDSKTLKEKSELEDLADDIEKFATDLPNYLVKPVVFIGAVIIALGEWLMGKSVMRLERFHRVLKEMWSICTSHCYLDQLFDRSDHGFCG